VSLGGIFMTTNYANLTNWAFPANATIAPGEFKVVFADGLTNLSTAAELHASFTLSAGTGSLALSRLTNGQVQVLDYADYSLLPANRSYGSQPDGQSFDRSQFFYATPGASNNIASAPLTVCINEVMAGNTQTLANPVGGKFDDWFELYNYGTNSANLQGYYLTTNLGNKTFFEIPSGYTIPPHGFLLVWADKKSTNGTPDLHVSKFKLTKSGTSIELFGSDGTLIDSITFGAQTSDVSLGRYPDGGIGLVFMTTPTPRTNNVEPNTAPTLEPITNRTIVLGQTVAFTAIATDPQSPQQTLTFSLTSNTPAGALIDPATGVFTWTPAVAPATNTITVTVTDNGSPQLSASQNFTIAVVPVPQLSAAVLMSDFKIIFSWPSVSGLNYQIEYKDDLSDTAWIPLFEAKAGTGETLSVSSNLDASQRFFRMRIVH